MANRYNLENFNLKPNRKIGDWTLSKKLGGGGNGEVWKCRDEEKNEIAIKFLKWGKGMSYKRFLDEVSFMEQYHGLKGVMPVLGKNLPTFYSEKYDKTIPFFYVMPLAEPAEDKLGKMSLDEKIKVIQELLSMLSSLHNQNIAHRDIKPANILYYNGSYVLSDFGLVYFAKKSAKTPKGTKLGAKWTISPQMERDAQSADKYKADVYSMAKTIWMILTGDKFGFEGQYSPNSSMGLRQRITSKRYFYPLEKLLVQCTDHDEIMRPSALELEQRFNEWVQLNDNWDRTNLLQWAEIQEQLFPSLVPTHAIWRDSEDIVGVLRLLGKYNSLNHMFFPDGGGLDLTNAAFSNEAGCIELTCDGIAYVVKPKRLIFEYINDEYEWNYFVLETDSLEPEGDEISSEGYVNPLCEIGPLNYVPYSVYDEMSSDEIKASGARQVIRYLKGSFVFFHKDSIYNNIICQYRGEHEQIGVGRFRGEIEKFAYQFKGQTMESIRAKRVSANQ